MKIAPQGFRYIAASLVLAAAAFLIAPLRWLAWVFLALGAFVAFFFRDPTRVPPADPKLLVSPADGKVVEVGPSPEDPSRQQVSIFLSIFDVHINRSPLAAVVEKVRYTPGEFLAAYRKEAAMRNERNELELRDGDFLVTVRQIAGVVARRIVCAVSESDRLERGQKFGLIQFGSRTEVVLPGDTVLLIRVGERVRGGETAIGRRP
ncbi:MAG: phosphatidylserine decarboxylase [Vicinamibacteria bacterium]